MVKKLKAYCRHGKEISIFYKSKPYKEFLDKLFPNAPVDTFQVKNNSAVIISNRCPLTDAQTFPSMQSGRSPKAHRNAREIHDVAGNLKRLFF